MRYVPPYVLNYEKLIWGDILNLERDVVITLENKFNVRISGYNVYSYDEKIFPRIRNDCQSRWQYRHRSPHDGSLSAKGRSVPRPGG